MIQVGEQNFGNFKISYFYVLKKYGVKYVDIYMRSVRKKVPLKNTLYFQKSKKDKFLIVNSSKIIYFFIRNLSFLYFLKYKVFFNKTFLCMLLLYISFYIFNAIISRDIEVWNLNFFKNLKVMVSMCQRHFPPSRGPKKFQLVASEPTTGTGEASFPSLTLLLLLVYPQPHSRLHAEAAQLVRTPGAAHALSRRPAERTAPCFLPTSLPQSRRLR
jgi:hypothetical protein